MGSLKTDKANNWCLRSFSPCLKKTPHVTFVLKGSVRWSRNNQHTSGGFLQVNTPLLLLPVMACKRCIISFLPPGQYQVVGGIVSPVSDGYGKQGLVLAKHRIAMARLALQSSNWVTVDEWESQQPDWTETAVTMRYYSATARTLWNKVIVIQVGWVWDGLCSLCALCHLFTCPSLAGH